MALVRIWLVRWWLCAIFVSNSKERINCNWFLLFLVLNFQSLRVQNFRAKNFRNLLLRWISDVCSCQKGARKFHKKLYLPLHPFQAKSTEGYAFICIDHHRSSFEINARPIDRTNWIGKDNKRVKRFLFLFISFHFITRLSGESKKRKAPNRTEHQRECNKSTTFSVLMKIKQHKTKVILF